jgi:hypothetical protein
MSDGQGRRTISRQNTRLGVPCTAGNTENLIMNVHISIGPLAALIAGILILVAPKLLNYIVAVYLIIVGLVGLFGTGNLHFH